MSQSCANIGIGMSGTERRDHYIMMAQCLLLQNIDYD